MHGWRWERACPGNLPTQTYAICRECPPLPGNASWANLTIDPMTTNGRALEECAFDCLPGFYHAGGGCEACTATGSSRTCPAGFRLSECTALRDANCDTPCVDTNKPTFYSHWEAGSGCPWACDDGYELRVWDYVMFQLRECSPTS
jgi:hypothetical protein